MYFVYKKSLNNVLSYTANYRNSLVEALSKADGEPVSNGSVAPLPPPPWVPEDIPGDWVWLEELVILVPEVEISAASASLVLAGRDLNVLSPPLVAVVETEVLVVGKSETLLSVAETLDGW